MRVRLCKSSRKLARFYSVTNCSQNLFLKSLHVFMCGFTVLNQMNTRSSSTQGKALKRFSSGSPASSIQASNRSKKTSGTSLADSLKRMPHTFSNFTACDFPPGREVDCVRRLLDREPPRSVGNLVARFGKQSSSVSGSVLTGVWVRGITSLLSAIPFSRLSIFSIPPYASFRRFVLLLKSFGYLPLCMPLRSRDRAKTSAAYLRGLPSIWRVSGHRFLYLYI